MTRSKWHKGVRDWVIDDTAYLSIVFTWDLPQAYSLAVYYKSQGLRVVAGGPGTFTRGRKYLDGVAEIGTHYDDAVALHNSQATFASRGCPVGCWFCIVPKMEGRTFTEIENFPVRPILCDNNLSALSPEYQDHIIKRYIDADVPLLDANSGFEPRTFTEDVYKRWRVINRGAWRFAYDDQDDGPHVERVMQILKDLNFRKKRVYVLIGNEPVAECLDRIYKVIGWGGDPYVQPFIKLNALSKTPHVRFDWSQQLLRDVARWCNGFAWKLTDFNGYRRKTRFEPAHKNQLAWNM
tara:strand:+ start:708 stop:1589 length:882 start_codon:yes stop_codon:yes gene_type:complete